MILGGIIGMGFASGKEVYHFFCHNYGFCFIAILIFVILFSFCFFIVSRFISKNQIKDYREFNNKIFGDYKIFVIFILVVIYITNAGCMLAGVDNIAKTFFLVLLSISR